MRVVVIQFYIELHTSLVYIAQHQTKTLLVRSLNRNYFKCINILKHKRHVCMTTIQIFVCKYRKLK